MASKDIEKFLYNGSVKINYLDGPHMYYAAFRENWDLPKDDPKAWGKKTRPKGTTTLLGDTLEKKGLMTWPLGLALKELFGFYDFTNEKGEKMTGFSKGVGTMWELDGAPSINPSHILPMVLSASKAWQRKQKKGADIGSVVHEAIEHFVKGEPFHIGQAYTNLVHASEYDSEEAKAKAIGQIKEEIEQATLAFNRFCDWWNKAKPELIATEDLVYSKEHHVCGTFDGLLRIDEKIILADWKTSNASKSKEAAAPQGVYYSYFIQSAIYAMIWEEMGNPLVDDLMIVSCRKDGGFDVVLASDLDLTVEDCVAWARAVIQCYRFMDKSKQALIKLGEKV